MNEPITWTTTHGDTVEVWRSLQIHADGLDVRNVEVWYWHVIARNGRIVGQGEGHSRKHAAVKAAERHHPRLEGIVRARRATA